MVLKSTAAECWEATQRHNPLHLINERAADAGNAIETQAKQQ